jgi:hypothetical protein
MPRRAPELTPGPFGSISGSGLDTHRMDQVDSK